MNTSKNYWLLKSEPSSWSWDQQKKKKTEHWDGVRNYQAANKYLNTELQKLISTKELNYHQVPLSLCTDNAAMIGWNAIEIMKSRKIKYNNYNIRPTPNILIHEHF